MPFGDENKLFLGGLAADTTTKSLQEALEQYGALTDCVVMADSKGYSRCFGFVTFENRSGYEDVLSLGKDRGGFEVDGKVVEVKEVDGKGRKPPMRTEQRVESRHRESYRDAPRGRDSRREDPRDERRQSRRDDGHQERFPRGCKKLFLGGLSFQAHGPEIAEAFRQFGEVVDSVAMYEKSGKHRGFGFVTFASSYAAEKAYRHEIVILNKPVALKPADGLGGPASERRPSPPRPTRGRPEPERIAREERVELKQFDKDANKVYVKNLPTTVNDDRLRLLFEKFGEVSQASAQTDRGMGFVTFMDSNGPANAVNVGILDVDGIEVEIQHYNRDSSKRKVQEPSRLAPIRHEPAPKMRKIDHGSDRRDRVAKPIFKNSRKLFVGGVPKTVSSDQFLDFFSQFGDVEDHIVMWTKDGMHRGFGFVTFVDASVAEEVLEQGNAEALELEGKILAIKEADGEKPGKMNAVDEHKVFVGNLDTSVDTAELEAFFSEFGSLNDAISFQKRGFGYIRFDDKNVAKQVVARNDFELGGKMMNLKPCSDPPREVPLRR